LGDGYLHHRGSFVSLVIAVDASDADLVEELCRVGRLLFGLEFALAPDQQRLTARGTAALAEFIQLNGLGGRAHTKRIPDWVHGLPRSQRLSFLAGYVDADGYVRSHPTAKNVVITSANADLLGDAKQLAALCGIASSRVVTVSNKHPFDAERRLTAYQ